MDNDCGIPLRHPFPHLHKTTDRLPGTPGQPQKFYHPPTQASLYLEDQIVRDSDLTPGGPREHPAFAGLFYHIPLCAQPYSPSGKFCVQIGNNNL
ncbi:hypothetical protein AA0313_1133 [Acetobacter indonesiensis NRIC 0313]|jgi:hypothetical protein|nr:hypothetical protein AA0313_1133 [Acetobacter indonesiensis NRIC 0313]